MADNRKYYYLKLKESWKVCRTALSIPTFS